MELLASLLSALKTIDPEAIQQEYSVVCSRSSLLQGCQGLSHEAGTAPENTKKNRYKDVLPYDQSRVMLSLPFPSWDSDYINASFIQGASKNRTYIASQGPLSSTLTDFWRMIWQYDVKVIIMACREIEMGKKKCERYWAPLHQSATFGPFTVLNEAETEATDEMVVRSLSVTYNQETHSLLQYHFLSWPDHDVPSQAAGVLELLEQARTTQGTHTSPLLVHCSAGCGRTGVICALDYIHDLLVTKEITADFSIMKVVLELRTQRPAAVQTKDQYLFIFRAVVSMLESFLRVSGSLYSNLPQLQKPEEKNTRRLSTPNRRSQAAMNDTYAVVNKAKHPQQQPPADAVPRTPPPSHHYDNDPGDDPVYSVVKPRAQRTTGDSKDGRALLAPAADTHTDNEYEVFPSSDTQASSLCSPGHMGFNLRVQKPRGPRDIPAEWRRL